MATGETTATGPRKPFSGECASHAGRRRVENEDAFWLDEDIGLAAVADGVSSAHGGGVAAEICVRTVGTFFAQRGSALRAAEDPRACVELVRQALEAARKAMASEAEDRRMLGMATTLTVLLRLRGHVVLANLGDSRVYRIRDGRMQQLTHDHTLLAESLRAGVVPLAANAGRLGATITRYMSPRDRMEAQFYADLWQDRDMYLLCSDGLSTYVPEPVILDVILRAANLEEAVHNLVGAANQCGGFDNVTAVLVRLRQLPS